MSSWKNHQLSPLGLEILEASQTMLGFVTCMREQQDDFRETINDVEKASETLRKPMEAGKLFAVRRQIAINIDHAIKWVIIHQLPKKRQNLYRSCPLESFDVSEEYSVLTKERQNRIKDIFRQESMETLWAALYELERCNTVHTIQLDDNEVTYEKTLMIVQGLERCEGEDLTESNSGPLEELRASLVAALRALKDIREAQGASRFLFD